MPLELETAGTIFQNLSAGLPDKIREILEDVDFLVFENAAEASNYLREETIESAKEEGETPSQEELAEFDIVADAKGVFIGDPAEHEPEAEEGDLDGLKYEPEGYIVFISSNIVDADEAVLVFLHEVGHALGMDEREVTELGLAVAEAAKQQQATAKGTADATEGSTDG